MEATRCAECGDVRWSMFGLGAARLAPCEMCGGETVPERRRPHRVEIVAGDERRDVADAPRI